MHFSIITFGQQITISGKIADAFTEVPLPLVKVSIENTTAESYSDSDGHFVLDLIETNALEVILRFDKTGFQLRRIPVKIRRESSEIGLIQLQPDPAFQQNLQAIISISESELLSDEGEFHNISGILQSSRDVYANAAAFDFSQTFFRPRGYGAETGKILINGIEMNKMNDGRPLWSNWGGLNDMQRNQVFTNGLPASDYQFGHLGGTTNIIMRASKYQKGGRISMATSNRSYTGRMMASYASGEEKNGWFYAFSMARRFATEAYMDGSLYDANSFFMTMEKKFKDSHSLNVSAIYTPNIRGRSAPMTEEVMSLKGRTYNPYWGFQNNEIRNSRMREVREPILMLNHYWKIAENLELNSNVGYQLGEISNSRLEYSGVSLVDSNGVKTYFGGGSNPDPVYYQKLPSYFLRFDNTINFEAAFMARSEIQGKGQIDWASLYRANITAADSGFNAVYVLAEEVNRDNQFSANSILSYQISNNFHFNSSIKFRKLRSHNFARIKDLLGGDQFLDVDAFMLTEANNSRAQSDLRNPDRLVFEKIPFKYNYEIDAEEAEVFAKFNWVTRKWEVHLAGNLGTTGFKRTGYYQNGTYPENSLGLGNKVSFAEGGLKTGGLFKISGRQNLELNAAWFFNAPGYRNVFLNPRQNNLIVPDVKRETYGSADISYRYRTSKLNLRLTGYYTLARDLSEVSYYFADGLSGLELENSTAFVQEALSGMDKLYYGVEMGAEAQLTQTIKLKTALGIGEYIFANNPELTLSSAGFEGTLAFGKSYLKNYHLPGGPQTVAQFGFEYRDPDFWWVGTTVNYFANSFIDINPLTRTRNFQMDYDGQALVEYDMNVARKLLRQEKFDDYFLVNAVGGKSWRLKNKYLGTFASLNNILNILYKSGGFEQGRNANYRSMLEDSSRDLPLFAPKYWYGTGTSFFVNVYLRF